MEDLLKSPNVHHGRNIKRLREVLGVKQELIATRLELTQQAVSRLEDKEFIDDDTLIKVADVLKVPVAALKNMTDEATINYFNTFNEAVTNNGTFTMTNPSNCTFNPIEKIIELYERLLEIERNRNK